MKCGEATREEPLLKAVPVPVCHRILARPGRVSPDLCVRRCHGPRAWDVAGKVDRNLMPVADYGGDIETQDVMIFRGGAYSLNATSAKVNRRSYNPLPYQGDSSLGFRLARTIPAPAEPR